MIAKVLLYWDVDTGGVKLEESCMLLVGGVYNKSRCLHTPGEKFRIVLKLMLKPPFSFYTNMLLMEINV